MRQMPMRDMIPLTGTGGNTLLAHADRCWKAQEANAARLATRANLVLTAITAILGLKLFALGKEIEVVRQLPVGWISIAFWTSGASGAFCVIWALRTILELRLYSRRAELDAPSASAALEISKQVEDKPWRLAEGASVWYLFKITYNAALGLRQRNEQKQRSIRLAQNWLFAGILFLVMSIISYIIAVYGGHQHVGA
jgi:hypothetical protein